MEDVLWYVLASSRGGDTRARIVRALQERPRNANQLATELELDYTTVRHHLDVLMENNVVRRPADEYAAPYLFTEQLQANREALETVLATVEPGDEGGEGDARTGGEGDEGDARTGGEGDEGDGGTEGEDGAGAIDEDDTGDPDTDDEDHTGDAAERGE